MAVWWLWAGFSLLLAILLFIDLGVLNRHAHVISAKEALKQACFWIAIALAFNVAIYALYSGGVGGLGVYPELPAESSSHLDLPASTPAPEGDHAHSRGLLPRSARDAAVMWLTCYGVEMTLSLDNMLVIALIMGYFRIPAKYQHRVLFWGIVGAVLLRGGMILIGTALLKQFSWFIYVFGVILFASAIKMLMMDDDEASMEHNAAVRWTRKLFLVSERFHGPRFFTKVAVSPDGQLHELSASEDGENPAEAPPAGSRIRTAITPLLLALIVIDIADAIFAIDSIPAAFGISLDPFIVFTSNMFAILGLRAMFFALTAGLDKFKYLKLAMIFVLLFIAIKMLASDYVHLTPMTQLGVTAGILFAGVLASLKSLKKPPEGFTRDIADIAEIGLVRAKRIVLVGIGLIILLAGVLMTVPGMPGPGLLIIPIGLAILSAEFAWARYLQKRYMQSAAAAGKLAGDTLIKKPRPWLIPAVVMGTIAVALAGHYYFHPSAEHEFFYEKRNMIIIGFLVGSLIGQALWAWETMARYNRAVAEKGLLEVHRARPPIWLGVLLLAAAAGGTLALYVYGPGDASRAWHVGGLTMLGLIASLVWMTISRSAERSARGQ